MNRRLPPFLPLLSQEVQAMRLPAVEQQEATGTEAALAATTP